MARQMLINSLTGQECRIVTLNDSVMEELYVERKSVEAFAGNIYRGKIVNLEPSIQAAWAAGKRVALPRVVGDELQLHFVDSDTVLVEGAFSVREPPETAAQVQPEEVDFALVPALAVDPRGYRIGYGGGYYDKLIPRLGHACTCAVAYDFQLISEVPELPFDVAVDLVVTDERVIRAE